MLPSKVFICLTNIDKNSRDIWFKDKNLNKFGTFDYICSGNLTRRLVLIFFLYLHYDLIDRECLTTITMTIDGDVIHHHGNKIRLRT